MGACSVALLVIEFLIEVMCVVVYSAASDYKYAVQLLRLHPLVVVMVTLASLTQVHMRQLCTIL